MKCKICGTKLKKTTRIMTYAEAIANGIPENKMRRLAFVEFLMLKLKNWLALQGVRRYRENGVTYMELTTKE